MPDRTRVEETHGGSVLRVTLDAAPGNILDIPAIESLARILRRDGRAARLKAILFTSSGEHFSYGVSIQDHRPARARRMLRSFHGLFRILLRLDRVLVAAVRGRCLGGGMELACFCHRVFAGPDARLAQPEIDLGLFAPVASLILARRCGQAVADEACLSGRTYGAEEARAAGLVDAIATEPGQAAEEWIERAILPKSGAALRRAVRAGRASWSAAFLKDLASVERLYLDDLMATADAREGIEAFLARRKPVWKDR